MSLKNTFSVMSQKTPTVCITDTTPPTFAGIATLVANTNGSITASWLAASDIAAPIYYEVYVKKTTATGLFTQTNPFVVKDLSCVIFTELDGTPLEKDETYFVGVRARDAVGNLETNLISLSAVSSGVPDADIFSYILSLKGQSTGAGLSMEISQNKTDLETQAINFDMEIESPEENI